MTEKDQESVSWFVQSYYKPYVATAILSQPIIDQTKNSMTLCKVLLSGLKPSDINCSSNNKISEIPIEHQQDQSMFATSLLETDYLNLHIKPMARSTNSQSLLNGDIAHESSPVRVVIRETSRGRHRICVSQTLLRTHNPDM